MIAASTASSASRLGEYIVGAVGPGPAGPELRLTSDADVRHATAPPRTPPPPDRSVAIATTYFPGTTTASQASAVTVAVGQERDGIDMTVQLLPTARVEGTVSMPEGGVPRGLEVHLIASADLAAPALPLETLNSRAVDADGAFSFANVVPGHYTVLARGARAVTGSDGKSAGPPQMLWASTQITVDGEHVRGLSLSLEPGLTISGRVRFEETKLTAPVDLRTVRVMAAPADVRSSIAFAPGAVNAAPDGGFAIPGVTPGRYRLSAAFPGAGPPGWIVKSITASGQDALDLPFTVQPNQHVIDATITFTDRLGELTGTVTDSAGTPAPDYTVVIFPVDPSLWAPQSRRIQAVRPGADGAYLIANLPAGAYLLAAIDDVEPGEWNDRAFLQRLSPAAAPLAISDREQSVRNLRAGVSR